MSGARESGKGDNQRPALVPRRIVQANWAAIDWGKTNEHVPVDRAMSEKGSRDVPGGLASGQRGPDHP